MEATRGDKTTPRGKHAEMHTASYASTHSVIDSILKGPGLPQGQLKEHVCLSQVSTQMNAICHL